MSTEVAVMQEMGHDKLELIKKTVAKGATDLELELFLHACKRTGLDPLMKQIYAIKRKNNKTNTEDMSIQTGIDGYRLIADRTGKYAGSDEPQYLIAEDGWPDVASVTVTKLVDGIPCKFTASARWKEYSQEFSPMWKKMPFLMLGKCAEALALRKAFPAELSGVYTHEEMMQADNEQPTRAEVIVTNKQTAQAKIAELAKEMQEPARQEATDASPAVFIWRVGKHKGRSVLDIDLDYLTWACTNMQAEDHRLAAAEEIDRRQKQDVMAFDNTLTGREAQE